MGSFHAEIQVAARDWEHEAWVGAYYPDDLPEDWRLVYYSNEFRAVVLPQEQWSSADDATLISWSADTPEGFWFYLEVEGCEVDWGMLAHKAAALGKQLAGIVLRAVHWPMVEQVLSNCLQQASAIAPTSLLLPDKQDLNAAEQTLIQRYHVTKGWRLGVSSQEMAADRASPPWFTSGPLMLIQVAGNLAYSPRQWREIIEASQRGAGNGGIVLMMFGGECPDIEAMRSVATIGDLLAMPARAEPQD